MFNVFYGTTAAGGGGINKYECVECNITDLADALKDVPDFVKKIYLMYNKITAIPTDVFQNYTRLGKLNLNGNLISTIGQHAFRGMDSFELVFLNHNKLTSLLPFTFDGHGKLHLIYLDDNMLTEVSPDAFNDLPYLDTLSLVRNQLTTIASGTFDGIGESENSAASREQDQQH